MEDDGEAVKDTARVGQGQRAMTQMPTRRQRTLVSKNKINTRFHGHHFLFIG